MGHVFRCSFDDIGVMPQFLSQLLAGACEGLPIRWACCSAEIDTCVHDQGFMGEGDVNCDEVGVVFKPRESTLDIVVTCVAIIFGYDMAKFQCQMQNWWNESAK